MTIRIDIDMETLFAQVVDQTLFDYRRHEAPEVMAMSGSESDIFRVNLKMLLDRIYSGGVGTITGVNLTDYSIEIHAQVNERISPDVAASRIKDLLKAGMLAWWHSTRDEGLFMKYESDFIRMFGGIKSQFIGPVSRPYSYY